MELPEKAVGLTSIDRDVTSRTCGRSKRDTWMDEQGYRAHQLSKDQGSSKLGLGRAKDGVGRLALITSQLMHQEGRGTVFLKAQPEIRPQIGCHLELQGRSGDEKDEGVKRNQFETM